MASKPTRGSNVTAEQYPLGLPAYQKIANAEHRFDSGRLYSIVDVARLSGLSAVGVRQRAFSDNWPTIPIWSHESKLRRPAYISGDFLRDIQLKAGGKDDN